MADHNTGTVTLELRNANEEFITDHLELRFRNLRVQSLDFMANVDLQGAPQSIPDVIAFPDGHWQLEIFPKKYRFKSVFVDLPSSGESVVKETFFVDPGKVTPIFPSANDLQNLARWSALRDVLDKSIIKYDKLGDQEKAGLLNLFAKMTHKSSSYVWAEVIDIFEVKPARIYARVTDKLWDNVRALPERYHEEPDNGSMHKFGGDWTRLAKHASFKTPDPLGNLQLTFANDAKKSFAVDADLDDHQGLKHAFDVIKHKFSGDTNPYDIHEVLVKFQGIDPGYHFV